MIPVTYRSTAPRTLAILRTSSLSCSRRSGFRQHRRMGTRLECGTTSRFTTLLTVGDQPTKEAVTPRPRLPQGKKAPSPAFTKNMSKTALRGREVAMPHIKRRARRLRLPPPIGGTKREAKPTHTLTDYAHPLASPSRKREATQHATTKSHGLIKRRPKDQGAIVPEQDLTQAGSLCLAARQEQASAQSTLLASFRVGSRDPSISSLAHGLMPATSTFTANETGKHFTR